MMTISTNRQFLSNMLWRLFGFLILGGFIASCACEPLNRKLLQRASKSIECIDDENNTCETNEEVKSSTSDRKNQTRNIRDFKQEFLDVDDIAEVSARKKKGKGGHRILLYFFAAMKAALIYGLLHGVAVLAGKAVLVAKIALAVAIAAILKKNDHGVSLEVVKHPHTSYVQTHSSSVDYDHRNDYGDERSDYIYEHRKRRRVL